MVEITNANDVELVLEREDAQVGTGQSLGRMVVDDFSLTTENDNESVSGVGFDLPAGVSRGDVTYSWSFTMLGTDTDVLDMVSDDVGRTRLFSMTARKVADDGTVEWEYALQTCYTNNEEISASSGDPMEVPVEGGAVRLEKIV